MTKKTFLFVILLVISSTLQAQVAMGKWRTHFAYNNTDQIAQSENKVFAVSDGSLFSIDKRDGSMEFYSKVTGLNGTVISKIDYNEAHKVLLIIYKDGNIDFLSPNGVKNLPDFYNKQMSADKTVHHIHFHENKAFLSCNFGIITLNMQKVEIQDTYYIGDNASEVKVLNTTIHNENIYAVSETDVYTASVSNPYLISYESWSKMSDLPGIDNFQKLVSFGDNLVLLRSGKLYKKDSSNTWSDLDVSTIYKEITVSDAYLIGYTDTEAFVFDGQFSKTQITSLNTIKDGIYDNNTSKFWFAGDSKGVAEYVLNGEENSTNFYLPNGPAVNIPYKLKFAGERLFVLQGGRWAAQYLRPGIVMIFEDNKWKNLSNLPIQSITGQRVLDFIDIAVNPEDKTHFYISSYGTGVFEYRNDEFYKWHNIDNSTIESVFPGSYMYMRMGGGTYDVDGNIWFSNSMVNSSIQVLKKDGTWTKFNSPILQGATLGNILILNQDKNIKWLLKHRVPAGFAVINDNGTVDNPDDDQYIFHSSFPDQDKVGVITPEAYFCLTEDKKGAIWAGTPKGPLIFNNPLRAFEPDFTATRIKIPRNDGTNLADYLLENEEINAIAVDGANRKWIGTKQSGVYLVSENGQETIHHFTVQNSPLISNTILSIDINPVTGEVFFGTGNGLVSYQSDAAEAGSTFGDVHAYPNPVRENFSGVITITGLVENTSVKITDVAGNLVCETKSNGSIATWDGRNKFGQKVSTGIYLALCISPDGQESATVKILVIN